MASLAGEVGESLRGYGLGVVLAGAVVALGCALGPGCKTEGPRELPPPLVYTQKVEPEDVTIYSELIGTLDGALNADIRARVAGYIRSIDYKEGSHVKEGDLLFTLDPVLADAEVRRVAGEVERSRALLDKAVADVERLRPLAEQKAVSRQELEHAVASREEAQAQLNAARGQLTTAQANLSYTKVRAPISGVAGMAEVQVGTLVGQSDPTLLTTISQIDPIKVLFTLSEQDYLRYVHDMRSSGENRAPVPLELILADGSVHPYRGTLEVVSRNVDPATGTLTLKASFPNPDGALRPGQYGRVRGAVESRKGALLVPQRAVQELQGSRRVAVVSNGVVKFRPVVATHRVGSRWLIESGLEAGDEVVVEGIQKIKDGQRVQAEPAAEAVARSEGT